MRVVNEPVENGIRIGWIADDLVPLLNGQLSGDDGRAAAVTFFEDLKEIVAGLCIERFETSVVEDEKIDACERHQKPGVTSIASGERKFRKQLGNAPVKCGAIVPARLTAKRAGEPGLADAGWAADREIVVGVDPIARDEFLEQRPVEAAGRAIIDILDRRLMAQPRIAKPGRKPLVVTVAHLAVKKEPKAFGERKAAPSPLA